MTDNDFKAAVAAGVAGSDDAYRALLRSIPKLDNPSHTRLRVITGRPPDLVSPPPGCKFSPRCPYVQDRCRVDEPPLELVGSRGHRFACWYPLGTPENAAALESNLSLGLPQTMAMVEAPGGDVAEVLAGVDLGAFAPANGAGDAAGDPWSGGGGASSTNESST